MVPSGIVFDLDGTLILSHHDFGRMRNEIVRTAERYGAMPERFTVNERVGTTQILGVARRELQAANVPEGTLLGFDAEVNRLIDGIELEALPRTMARPGARTLLTNLRERGFRLGLFTRSSEAFCHSALARTGLGEFFAYVRTRGEPGPVKPSPAALHLLLEKMDIAVERAVFIGDHPEDAECAARAGVLFYGVLPDPEQANPTTAEQLLANGAVEVASNLAEIARLIDAAAPYGRRAALR